MESRNRTLQRPRRTNHEVPEFLVRRLDGHTIPVLTGTPDTGVVFSGINNQWTLERSEDTEIDFGAFYHHAVEAQNGFIATANKLCEKCKIPYLDTSSGHSWDDVEESVSSACSFLEELAKKDKQISPGFTGKLKSGFRRLCSHAGAGMVLTSLVPTDSYGVVLCGGLKIIFTAMEKHGQYRQEIYRALEGIPFALSDNAALVDLHRDKQDEELHRRAASLYQTLFELMDVILAWFVKSSLSTGIRMVVNPSGFSDSLRDRLAEVKTAAQRLGTHAAVISAREQRGLQQQNMHLTTHLNQKIFGEIQELKQTLSRLTALERITEFLDSSQDAVRERTNHLLLRESRWRMIQAATISAEEILERYLYEPSLVIADCQDILKMQCRPGLDVDENKMDAIQHHPRFRAFLTLNESSLLFLNANADTSTSLDMSVVSAKTYQHILGIAKEQTPPATKLVPLAFFCSQHRDYRSDVNGKPSELAMSILLQLIDRYGDFDPTALATLADVLDPSSVTNVLSAFGKLLKLLPSTVIVILIIDGLRSFGHPVERRDGLLQVMERLIAAYRSGSEATLKFLFTNPTRVDLVEHLFTEDETLRIPKSPAISGPLHFSVVRE